VTANQTGRNADVMEASFGWREGMRGHCHSGK